LEGFLKVLRAALRAFARRASGIRSIANRFGASRRLPRSDSLDAMTQVLTSVAGTPGWTTECVSVGRTPWSSATHRKGETGLANCFAGRGNVTSMRRRRKRNNRWIRVSIAWFASVCARVHTSGRRFSGKFMLWSKCRPSDNESSINAVR